MAKVYFAAAILGDRSNLSDDKRIISGLKSMGFKVLTFDWIVSDSTDLERGLTPLEIFERDMKLLNECDFVIADVSYPSLGVGFEIAYALLMNKLVIAFCRKDRVEKTSALIRGISWKNFRFIEYDTVESLLNTIKALTSSFKPF